MCKTLYVSDLDGTLLRSDEKTSEYTNETINKLVDAGMIFSYATARSYNTAKIATKGITVNIPLIVYNGTMVVDNVDGSFLIKNFFGEDVKDLIDDLLANNVNPIVYSFVENVEKFSYVKSEISKAATEFVATRKNDKRDNPVTSKDSLYAGEIFYVTCIDDEKKLEPFFEKYKDKYNCVFHTDIYTKAKWLEFMPKSASKSNAIRRLKEMLGCDRLVVFGDGLNDIDMFKLADYAYAVENASDELKAYATDIIESNEKDGVAKWLKNHFA